MLYDVLLLFVLTVIFLARNGVQDRIAFPDEYRNGDEHHDEGDSSDSPRIEPNTLIPLDFIQKLNNRNVSDLLLNYVDGEEEVKFIQSRFGDDGDDDEVARKTSAVLPKAAGCLPELQTVRIASSDDPTILYIPECTRVERCGGCCSHKLLSCQAQEIETINYKVMKTQYTGADKLRFVGKEVIQVERHTKCKCDCKLKAANCSRFQEYRKSECRCVCTNLDEEKKCYKNNNTKLWNPELCLCECREISQCSSGFKFDHNDCRCRPMRRRDITESDFDLDYD